MEKDFPVKLLEGSTWGVTGSLTGKLLREFCGASADRDHLLDGSGGVSGTSSSAASFTVGFE